MSDLCDHGTRLYDANNGLECSVVYQYSFCKPSNVLGNAEQAALLRRNLTELLRGVKVSKHFDLLFKAIRHLPLSLSRHLLPAGVKNMAELAVVGSENLTSSHAG